MNIPSFKKQDGFTIIELLVVIVVACILIAFVTLAYSGVQAKNRNVDRQNAIDTLKGQLETYYAGTDTGTNIYPTLTQLNDADWRSRNLKRLNANALQDPGWNKTIKACAVGDKAVAASKPIANCYSYQVTTSDGSACDNDKNLCAHYTLTATLEGGEKYVKTSLN